MDAVIVGIRGAGMNKKTLIILAVILVVVFVCGLGVGALGPCNPQQDPNCKISLSAPAWLGLLGGLLGGSNPLRSQDFPSSPNPPGCFQFTSSSTPDFTMNTGTNCAVGIASSSSPVRKGILTLVQGSQVRVVLSPGGDSSLPVDTRLRPSDGNANNGDERTLDLTIQKEGATLLLICETGTGSPSQCRVRLS